MQSAELQLMMDCSSLEYVTFQDVNTVIIPVEKGFRKNHTVNECSSFPWFPRIYM